MRRSIFRPLLSFSSVLILLFAMGCSAQDTPTPMPTAIPTPAVTRSPTPEVDPHIEISASTTTLHVGETVTIAGEPVDLGLPFYSLRLQEAGASDSVEMVRITYQNEVQTTSPVRLFILVSAEGEMNQATFVLQAQAPGTAEVWINATGEVHYGYPGPATWAGGASKAIELTVRE